MIRKPNPKPFVVLALLFIATQAAPARIGETMGECKAHYGKVIRVERSRPDYPQYCFRKGDVEICVRFLNDRSAAEVFHRADGGFLSQSQVSEILDANSERLEWKPAPANQQDNPPTWTLIRADGAVHADYFKLDDSDILTIGSFEFDKVFRAPGTGF